MKDEQGSPPAASAARSGISRRRFVVLSSVITAVALGAAGFLAAVFRYRDHPQVRRLMGLEIDASSGTGDLSETEIETLVAYADVLFPDGYDSQGEWATSVRRVVESSALELSRNRPGYRLEFRTAATVLDQESRSRHRSPFAALPIDDRRALIEDLLRPLVEASLPMRTLLCLLPANRNRWRLYSHVGVPLLEDFYRDSLGWRVLGYPYRPGSCSNLLDFQNPPEL